MNQTNIEFNKIRRKIVKIKKLQKKHKTIYADFYELLDSLPLNFKFKLTNTNSEINGYWQKTIYRKNSQWLKDDRILYNSSFFNFIDNVLDAIEQNVKSITNMELAVNRKASVETRRKLFIETLSREKFYAILDGLPSMFRLELKNIREDFDGDWERTILDGQTAWQKGDKILLNPELFLFKEEVIDAIERKYYLMSPYFFDLTKEKLEELYCEQNKSLEDIAKEYGTSRQNIMKIMNKYGLIRRKQSKARIEAIKKGKLERLEYHEVNENFFSEWSPQMAWVLGLLFTDGNVFPGGVSLSSVDIELLEKAKKLLNSTKPLVKQVQSFDKSKYIYRFEFYREKMRKDLNRLGLHQRKSLTMIFPDVPHDYMRHFIRGCWDGDGSVFLDRGNLVASYISGSKKFIERLVQELYKIGISKKTKPYHLDHKGIGYRSLKKYLPMTDEFWSKYPDGKFPITIHMQNINAYYIKTTTKENIEKLFHYFYDGVDESMYLSRKYEVFVKGLKLDGKGDKEQLTLDLDF